MKILGEKSITFVQALQCDKCGCIKQLGEFGFDEFLNISHQCGYDSGNDDGNHIEIDLCFSCFKEVLGQFWKIRSNWIDDLHQS